MFKGLPFFGMPFNPRWVRLSVRLTVGLLFVIFFVNFQSSLTVPIINRSFVVYAAGEQSQSVNSHSLPFVFQLPHAGYLSNPFSSWHPGIDIATGLGMPIKPIAPGTVSDTNFNFFGYGMYVEVDHGEGYRSFYAHLGKLYVQKGQKVSSSDLLGEVGLTGRTSGPHTHLEVFKDGNRIDPEKVLPALRKVPQEQDFATPGSSVSGQPRQTFTGGPTKLPTLGAKSAPTATPLPKATIAPVSTDPLNVGQVISQKAQPKPWFLTF